MKGFIHLFRLPYFYILLHTNHRNTCFAAGKFGESLESSDESLELKTNRWKAHDLCPKQLRKALQRLIDKNNVIERNETVKVGV